ncbi:extensin family protein [Maritalea sp. S77]|uniref:extensin-like domain-containing protein n=1 Tax=Maritalea sp. S77 TaxID=3415125 RepID=UPI003C79F1D2
MPLASLAFLAPTFGVGAAPVPPPRPAQLAEVEDPTTSKPEPKQPVYQAACPALMSDDVDAKIIPPTEHDGCGTQSPYQLNSIKVSGRDIKLATPATVNCAMATAFIDWVKRVDQLSRITHDAGIKSISTGTSYMCRRRNNAKTGKISEHGFANAIDLTGFVLTNGEQVQLPEAWQAGREDQKLIRQSHKLGCEIFTTVLGPEANALHKDHLHLDMGCHGKSCTYKICD